jgi:hypothetical protein
VRKNFLKLTRITMPELELISKITSLIVTDFVNAASLLVTNFVDIYLKFYLTVL